MSTILLLTTASSADVLPSLGLLQHTVRVAPPEASELVDGPSADAVLVDGRRDLAGTRDLCQLLRDVGADGPLIAVVTEGGLAAVTAMWGVDDILLDSAGPGEVEARLRLAAGRSAAAGADTREIRAGELTIDEDTYTAKLRGSPLNLTFKEFELLRYLTQHPGRVFTRDQLLLEVWGYDYFGGTRTVDVHIRRLRAKFGAEHESMIGTVRGVGYRFVLPEKAAKHGRPVTAPSRA